MITVITNIIIIITIIMQRPGLVRVDAVLALLAAGVHLDHDSPGRRHFYVLGAMCYCCY